MLKWIAGAAAGLFAFGYLFKLNRASQNIQTETKVKVHKVSLSGLALNITATIKNPNKLTLTLQQPLITIAYDGKMLGSSKLKDEKIIVQEYDQKSFEIDLHLGWLSLTQTFGLSLVDKIRNQGKTSVDVDVIITTEVNGIPYTDTQTSKLQF